MLIFTDAADARPYTQKCRPRRARYMMHADSSFRTGRSDHEDGCATRKIVYTLFCASACVMLLAGGAFAHETGKPHKHRTHKAQGAKPEQPKDPYAKYWHDPVRAAPPFSHRGRHI